MSEYNLNNNYGTGYGATSGASTVSSTMKRVYVKMTLGLLVTALVSLALASSAGYMTFLVSHSWMMWVFLLAELGIVFAISGALNRLSSPVATMLFYVFAALNGATLCTIFYDYSAAAITKTFFITAGTFGAMSVFGYTTRQDLSKFGAFLFMALIGLIIASVVNLFLHSDGLSWIVSIIGVLIFVGLTAWDTQQIKNMAAMGAIEPSRLATIGALNLYLDFINLFLYLLRIFGNSRD